MIDVIFAGGDTLTAFATLRRITHNRLGTDQSSAKSLNRKRLRHALDPNYLISLLKILMRQP